MKYLLLSLVRTTKVCSSLEDNKAIPNHSRNVRVQDENQYLPHHSQNIDYYPNVGERIPIKHAESEIQEFEDYPDERDSSNLNKGGLSLFSWWKTNHQTKTNRPTVTGTTLTQVIETFFVTGTNSTPVIEITFPNVPGTGYLPNTVTTSPPDVETAFTPKSGTTSLLDAETTFPTLFEIIFPNVTGTSPLPNTVTTSPPDAETAFTPESGTASLLHAETTFPALFEITFPNVTGTSSLPHSGTTFPPDVEKTFAPGSRTTSLLHAETTFPALFEIIFPNVTGTSSLPNSGTTFPPDVEKTFAPESGTTSLPDAETTRPPLIEITFPTGTISLQYTGTTFPPEVETAFAPGSGTTSLLHAETTFPALFEIIFPNVTGTISLQNTGITSPPDAETAFAPERGITSPPEVETTRPSDNVTTTAPDADTTCPPLIGTTCPPNMETTCISVIGTIYGTDTETTCPPDSETTCPPDGETTCPSDSETTCPPDSETTCPPESETTCPPETETTCPPDIETTFLPDIKTTYPPDTETTCPPDTETTCPPDTVTTCPPDTGTTCPPDIEQTNYPISPDMDNSENGSATFSYSPVSSNTTNGFSTISPITKGQGTIGYTENGSGTAGSTTNAPSRISFTTNGPGTIGIYTNGHSTIEAGTFGTSGIGDATIGTGTFSYGTTGAATISSGSFGACTIGSATNGPGPIEDGNSPVTNVSGAIGSPTIGSGATGTATIGSGEFGTASSGSGAIGSPTIGSGETGPATTGSGATGNGKTSTAKIGSRTISSVRIAAHTTNFRKIGSTRAVEQDTPSSDDSTAVDDGSGDTSSADDSSDPFSIFNTDESIRITVDPVAISTDPDSSYSESDDIRITVDPAAISTEPDSSNSESDDIRITVDPAAISTDIDTFDPDSSDTTTTTSSSSKSTRSSSTSGYITACYTITMDCSPITIGTPVICDTGIDSPKDSTASLTTTTGSATATGCTADSGGDVEDETASVHDDASDLTTATVQKLTDFIFGNVTATSPNAMGCTSSQSVSTGIPPPPALKMIGAGMFLPVYQFPLTRLMTQPPAPTNQPKKVALSNDQDSVMSKIRSKNISSDDQNRFFKNYLGMNNDRVLNGRPTVDITVSNLIKNRVMVVSDTKKATEKIFGVDNINIANRFDSSNYALYNRQIENRKETSQLNNTISQNQNKEILSILPEQTYINPADTHTDFKKKNSNQILAPLKIEREHLIAKNRISEQSLEKPGNMFRKTLNTYDFSNPLSYAEPSKTVPSILTKNHGALKNNSSMEESKALSGMKNYYSEFVKYNDTYLSQNSNMSINLVDLCKNVTCQGNNYLSQCCSRVCGPEKCEGEDFSYLHPIPGDTTTVTTTVNNLRANTSYTTQIYSNFKQNKSRVARENNVNDFIKFQLMSGLTAPDGKEMMNTLKEANLDVPKVNREFYSNDRDNFPKANGNLLNNLPIINYHRLSKKEPESIASHFIPGKKFDDIRATISKSLVQSNHEPIYFQKDKYRVVRNQDLQDQLDCFRENNIILEKLKKETEIELKRLRFLEAKRREEEMLFNEERDKELKELKTIQELIHREFESRVKGDSAKRAISDTVQKLIKQDEPAKKESTYNKLVKNIENSARNNDLDNLILNRYSPTGGNASDLVSVNKFPELELKKSASTSHDEALLVLNIGSDIESLSEEYRKRRECYYDSQNKILKENNKSVDSSGNIPDTLG